jgi:uncharacterized protein
MKHLYIPVVVFFILSAALLSCSKGRTIIKDDASVITPPQHDSLESVIRKFEERTGAPIGVYTFHSLEGRTLAEVSKTAFKKSGLADTPNNDGVLISMAMMDRAMRIEVGASLKDVLTDERCDEIMMKIMLPHYIKGHHFYGLSAGVHEIMGIIESHKLKSNPVTK